MSDLIPESELDLDMLEPSFTDEKLSEAELSFYDKITGNGVCMSGDWPQEPEVPPEPATEEEAQQFIVTFFTADNTFFADKNYYLGGSIPTPEMVSEHNVQMVLRLNLVDCIDIFYQALKEIGVISSSEQIALFFRLQRECARLGIPKHHSGGILLVWLKLCRGFDL